MPLKPPPHPQPVKAGLERFGVYGTRWGAMAVIALVALWGVNKDMPVPPPPPLDGALPVQQWTTDLPLGAISFRNPAWGTSSEREAPSG